MRKSIMTAIAFAVVLFAVAGFQGAHAQKMTEIYIPIGQSPGLAGYTEIGTITSINPSEHRFTLRDSLNQDHAVQLTDSTSIWLDRSSMRQQNRSGSIDNIEEGLLAEVKFYLAPDSTYLEQAEWVKIRITASQ